MDRRQRTYFLVSFYGSVTDFNNLFSVNAQKEHYGKHIFKIHWLPGYTLRLLCFPSCIIGVDDQYLRDSGLEKFVERMKTIPTLRSIKIYDESKEAACRFALPNIKTYRELAIKYYPGLKYWEAMEKAERYLIKWFEKGENLI